MLTYPWKCTVLHCNHLGNTWKPLVLMTRHFDYCPSASEGDNQSVRSSAPVVSRCFPGGYNVKLYISRGRLAWWLLAFLYSDTTSLQILVCNILCTKYRFHVFGHILFRGLLYKLLVLQVGFVGAMNYFVFRKSILVRAATDGRVVTAGISVTWNVLSWSRGHKFEPRLGRSWGA